MKATTTANELTKRAPDFSIDVSTPVEWHPRLPEFAAAANSVSLMMPDIEPYIVRAVQQNMDKFTDPVLRERAEDFIYQEAQHYKQHRKLNHLIMDKYPATRTVTGWVTETFTWMEHRFSPQFALAWAAGGETVAYSAATWAAKHTTKLFHSPGVNKNVADLFVWHLAEETEHRSAAHDLYWQTYKSRFQYAMGMLSAFYILAAFAVLVTTVTAWKNRSIFNPVRWARLAWWSFGFLGVLVPNMAKSMTSSYHPSKRPIDPIYSTWLHEYDTQQAAKQTVDVPSDTIEA